MGTPDQKAPGAAEAMALNFDCWPLEPLFPVRWKEPAPKVIVTKPPPTSDKKQQPLTPPSKAASRALRAPGQLEISPRAALPKLRHPERRLAGSFL